MKKQTYIVLVNWNGWADTLECLESIFCLDDKNFTVIVVDNGSKDQSIQRIISWADGNLEVLKPQDGVIYTSIRNITKKPMTVAIYDNVHAAQGGDTLNSARLVLVHNPRNIGFAGANNIGIRFALARGDAARVWLLNNDTVVHTQALSALIRRMAEQADCGMCGSTLLFYDRPDCVQAYGGGRYVPFLGLSWHIGFMEKFGAIPKPLRAERFMNYVVGASLCVSTEFIEKIGLMNEDYFLFFEEVDWSFRSRGKYRLAYAPDSIVYHKVGSSIGTSSNPLKKSYLCDYYNLRNRIRFTQKYASWAFPGVYGVMLLSLILRLLLRQWQRAFLVLQIMTNMKFDFREVKYRLL